MGWLASRMNFHFKKPVYFGDTITCQLVITAIDKKNRAIAAARYQNQDGMIVLEADLEGILPETSDREILSAMVQEGDPTNKL
jgi:acyl-CoA thioesterase FadM